MINVSSLFRSLTKIPHTLRVNHATALGLIFALWLALGAFSTWDVRTELTNERLQADTLADALSAHTSRVLREANQAASVVAWLVRRDGVDLSLENYVHSGLLDLDVFSQIAVIDKHGVLRASTIPGFKPIDLSDREHFRVHLDDPSTRLFVGRPVIGRISGEASIQLSQRVDDPQGRFLGVIVISMPPSYLTELYDTLRLGHNGLVSVVGTADFSIRARRSGDRSNLDWLRLPENSPLRVALSASPRGHFDAVSPIDHVRRSVSYRTLPDYPLVVMVGFSNAEFLAAFRMRMLALVIAGVVLTALILAAEARQSRLFRRLQAASGREREAHERTIAEAKRADALFKAIPDCAIGLSADGHIDGYNPRLLELLGWSDGEIATATPFEIARAFFRADPSAQRDGKARQFAQMLDGTALAHSANAVFHLETPFPSVYEMRVERRGADSSGVVALIRDVSREHANEQALMQSESRYRQLIELSPYAVFLIQEFKIAFANPKALEMLGAYSATQIRGLSIVEFVHAEHREVIEERIGRLLRRFTAAPAREEKWLRLDGTAFIGEMTAVPYELDGVRGALVMLQDITGRKEAETQRDRLFDLSLDLTCLADPAGRFKRVNPAFTKVLGWTADELLSRPFIEFVHPEDRTRTMHEIESRRPGEPIDQFENRYLCKDGSTRWLAWKAIQLEGLVYATARDVTESRRATRQLEQARADAESASRAKSAFLATMSHEIRTPMNGVIGMIEVLSQSPLSTDQGDMVTTIRESANALLTLIDDILDFSKIEAGRLHIERVPLSIAHLVDGLCQSLMPVADRAGVKLSKSVSPDLPKVVLSDDTRLRQVLYNLVGNAIKFSGGRPEKPGAVSVTVEAEPHPSQARRVQIRFHVADNGIGMSADTLPKLFKPFTQAEASTTRRFGGTGLGLAICRRLCELMGGEVSAQSELGAGSTFTVSLPLEIGEAAPDVHRALSNSNAAVRGAGALGANRTAPSIAQARELGRLILVAEDDAINQKVILRQLALLGHAAEIAGDGREALALWRANRYALLLTDLHMPEMDGYELVETIRREEEPAARLPIIALTANAVQGEAARAKAVGMDGYLTKPLQLARLQAVLDAHFPLHDSAAAVPAAPAPEPAPAHACAVDIEVLKGIVGDDPDTVRELLSDYQQSVGRLAGELRAHCDAGRGREAGAIAHKLKSSSRSVGALTLGDLCAELENAGKAGDLALLANWAKQFDSALAAVEHSLDRLLAMESR
ncbi:PAS domain S-box protein [Trinickia diaoshuihuensis]|uniref:PAS domain S-box protein n=1 Tax=Trinickia diaoshuihuensis TaxID=2292265 RepID=UPI000E24ED54|nr:PAS domain S-box protein [Trinickia diaoshuihuensis]